MARRIRLDERGQTLRLGEADGRRRRILIINAGWGSSGYYPADVLERDGPQVITAGTHMYVDHPGQMEERDRANVGRSIRDLAAVLESDAVWDPQGSDGAGLYAEARIVPTVAPLIDDLAEHIGVSIRGAGEGRTGEADGRKGRIITALTAVESIDFVTRAGRGGRVLEILESARTVEALTANELRDELDEILTARHGDDDTWVWVADYSLDDGWVVFSIETRTDGVDYFRADLTVDGDDVTVGAEETPVEREVSYVPTDDVTEALREARARLAEARNVGAWFEAHIHRDFTVAADDAYANGRLTRDERIALSHSIGAALDAFTASLEVDAPHLYDRDPYDNPSTPIPTEEATVPTIEELQAQVTDLEGRLSTVEAERDTAQTELARRQDADRVREAQEAVEAAIAAVDIPASLTDVAESLRERAARQVTVTRDDQGAIAADALAEAARQAVGAEVDYIAGLPGARVTGLGEGAGGGTPDPDDELREANNEKATKLLV